MKYMPGDVVKFNKFIGVVLPCPEGELPNLREVYYCTLMFRHGRFSSTVHFNPEEAVFIGSLLEFGIEWEGPYPNERG